MARYIDADGLIEKLQETICSKCNMYDGIKCKSCGIDDTLDFLENAPTADVVPKSEYDAVVSAVDNSTKEFLKLHDDYQEAKREVDRLKYNLKATLEEIPETKADVAREIFAEIDLILFEYNMIVNCEDGFILRYAELKKKYTEDME